MSTHKLSRRGFNSIVQVGPTRSGTTLIYNIFRTIFKGPRIEKTHLPFYENYSYKQRDYEQPILYPISISIAVNKLGEQLIMRLFMNTDGNGGKISL